MRCRGRTTAARADPRKAAATRTVVSWLFTESGLHACELTDLKADEIAGHPGLSELPADI